MSSGCGASQELIVPGTTIGVSLIPGYVEIRDKGLVKKKIPTKHRSFDDVLEEVEMFFRARRKILAPGTLREVLVRIGLPQAKVIVSEKEPAPPPADEEPEIEVAAEPEPVLGEELETPPAPPEDEAATFVENPDLEVSVTQLDGDEFQDISDALSVVESMSDSFMAAAPKNSEVGEPERPKLKIEVAGVEEVTAAPTTYASAPSAEEEKPIPVDDGKFISDEAYEPPSSEPESTVPDTPVSDAEPALEPVAAVAPGHVVKPLLHSKILILGEDGVGKQSLMNKAVPSSDDVVDFVPYIHSKVFETEDYRVRLNVWSFDEAVKSKISRNEFYDEAEALIIVYAASDRWSFDSIDFWLKEASITTEELPPIVIAANKTDLVVDAADDTGDQPVTKEEGFALAEELAQRFGDEERLHPVAFIGTSCLTGEGVVDVFVTAAQLASRYK
ncbi:MAG: ADP-ribosylation factor-like protein [Candidatus Sifarchaeia archaeon]